VRCALALALLLGATGCAGAWPFGAPFSTPEWEKPPPLPVDAVVVQPGRLQRADLPNGVRVLVLEDRRLPAFTLGVVIARGAGVEALSEAGVASYSAELMERGAGTRTALELAGVVDALGASLEVSASWDSISAQVAGLSQDRDVLFDLLADVVLRPRFDADEAERVRAESLAALRQAADDPGTLLSWSFAKALYAGHRYGLPESGTEETVARLGAAAARAFHRRVFVPGAAIVFASGDVDPAQLLERIRATYGAWPGSPPPDVGTAPPIPQQRRIVVVDRPDLGQAQIGVGHGGIARSDPRRLPVQLLNSALGGGGFSSRLMTRIRSEEGLTYGISSQFVQRHRAGPFAVFTFTRVPKVGEVVTGILEELERIRREPPTAEELARVQSQRAGQFALALETSSEVAAALVDLEVYGLPRDSLDSYRGRVRGVTPPETAAVAQDLIDPARASIVVVGPAELLRPQLEPFGAVEVVQP
jgi:zinc protease